MDQLHIILRDDIEQIIIKMVRCVLGAVPILIIEIVLERLYETDKVAYIRFASVYRHFEDLDEFIKEARKILGSNVIVAISVYNIPLHIKWMKTMKNTLILNGEEFHFKYLKALMKMNVRYLEELKDEIINHYVNTIPNFGIGEFNNDILRFPKFKNEGFYNDLTFNELDKKKCQIF